MKREVISLAVILFSFLLAVRVGLAATPITNCTDITSSGEYYLANDINASGYGVCINIQSDNVVLDGMGHKIYFPVNTTNKAAIGSGWQTNVIVKNLIVEYGEIAVNGYNNTYEDINLYYGRIWTNSNSNNIKLRNINFYEHPTNGYENLDITNGAYNINIKNVYFNVTPKFPLMFIRGGSHDIYIKNLTAIGDGLNLDCPDCYNVVLDEYTYKWAGKACLPIYGGMRGLVINNSLIESGYGPYFELHNSKIFNSNDTIIENSKFLGIGHLDIRTSENITLKNLYVNASIVFFDWAKDVKILNSYVNDEIMFGVGEYEDVDIENNEANHLVFSIYTIHTKNSYIYNNNFTWMQIAFMQNSTICNNNVDAYSFYDTIIQGWNDYYSHEKSKGIYVGKECKHVEDGILVEDINAHLDAGNVSIDVRNSIVPYVFLFYNANVSIEGNPNIEIDVSDIGSLKQIFGSISIHTLFNTSVYVIRNVSMHSSNRVEFVDNTSKSTTLYYYVCGLKPNAKYELYLNGVLNQTIITDPSGCTDVFPVTFHSPVRITLKLPVQTGFGYLHEQFPLLYLLIALSLGAGLVYYIYYNFQELLREVSRETLLKLVLLLVSITIIGYVLAGIL